MNQTSRNGLPRWYAQQDELGYSQFPATPSQLPRLFSSFNQRRHSLWNFPNGQHQLKPREFSSSQNSSSQTTSSKQPRHLQRDFPSNQLQLEQWDSSRSKQFSNASSRTTLRNQSRGTTFQVYEFNPYQNMTTPYPVLASYIYDEVENFLRTKNSTQQHCEHGNVELYCRECRCTYCITCLATYPCCAHDRFLLCDVIAKMKKDNENLEKRFDTLFTEVNSRIQGAIDSYRMTTNLRIMDIIRIGIQNNYGWYINRLSQILANLCTIADILEESLRSGNPLEMAKAQIIAFREIEVLEHLNSTTYLCTPYDGISIMTLTHGFRCKISIQINSIKLYNYNRPIYGVRHPVVIKKGKLSDIKAIGKRGRGNLEFCKPWGVACNKEGLVIVTDRSNDRIKVLDPEGNFLWQFGQTGSRVGDLYRPAGVTINKAGNIVVADKDNHRIQIFTINGVPIRAFGRQGSRPGELHYPYSVGCNAKEEILVSDSKNQRIQLFQEDGVLLRIFKFGIRLNPYVKLCDTPRDVCFTPTDNILVSDFETHAILRFESRLNRPPFSIGSEGTAIGQFQRPQGIACDDEGNVVIVDSKNHRIILRNSSGDFECIFSGTGGEDLNRPCGICITPKGRLIVVDTGNDRLLFL